MIDLKSINTTDSPKSFFRSLSFCIFAALIMMFALSLPTWSLYGENFGLMPTVHLVLELFSIVVSILVVIVAWQAVDGYQKIVTNPLVYGFCVVAGVDLVHALSYEGMPVIWAENSTAKAVYFWLAGRIFELITIVMVAARMQLPGTRHLWLAGGFLTIGVLTYIGNFHLEKLPTMFVPGQGVTLLKAIFEYALCFGNLFVAGWLFLLSQRDFKGPTFNLAVASFLIGVGELAFTSYIATSDFINVLGHIYKVVAYAFIFRAAFEAGFSQPYAKLLGSEQQLARKQGELLALMDALPVGVVKIDQDLRYLYVNPFYERVAGTPLSQIKGKSVSDVVPEHITSQLSSTITMALEGNKAECDYSFTSKTGETVNRSSVMVPTRNELGVIDGVLAILIDTTERMKALNDLMLAQREVYDLKSALDEHAIVAITDSRGVITQVNDKFCEISKYTREELIGNTHGILNSGEHAKSFFQDLWRTILEGQVWNGEICNRAKDGSTYWVYTTIVPFLDVNGRPIRFIAIRADITKRKLAEQKAQHMALHDSLTGLPNRRLMHDRLRHAMLHGNRNGNYAALLLLDIDNFKEINDTLGHIVGDSMLREFAQRLEASVRPGDTVARLGGDEFVIVLDKLSDQSDEATTQVRDIAERIYEITKEPFDLEGQVISVSQSIGAVLFQQADENTSELLKQADIALYRAKADGRNRLRFFDPSLQADISERLGLIRDLRTAIDHRELILYYQPVVDINGSILGVEALIRWKHPDRGMVSPVRFIPLAEQTNLILSIGRWALLTACEQLSLWANDPVRCTWSIAVNVSARQLFEPEFVSQVQQILVETAANPNLLRLELTESMLQRDLDETITKMVALQRLGIRFALDDFGTGYSSLSYLKRLPLDQIKIDKSFVDDILTRPNDAAILQTILSMAGNLGLNVVAEGVEVKEQFDFLVQEGCQMFQGYFFSRPLPVNQLHDSLSIH